MRKVVDLDRTIKELMGDDESIRFAMFKVIKAAEEYFILTDDKNIIIGQDRPTAPLWIYIKKEPTMYERDEIIKIICERLQLNPSLYVDGDEWYLKSILKEVTEITHSEFKVSLPKNSYVCYQLKEPHEINGVLSRATEEDAESLALFCKHNWEDIGFGILTEEQSARYVRYKMYQPGFHVWRTHEGRIVAMASVHKYDDIAILDGVFTQREERGKGYAKALTYKITEALLEEGITPILYSDSRKTVPNHVYRSLGYEYKGRVTEYEFID